MLCKLRHHGTRHGSSANQRLLQGRQALAQLPAVLRASSLFSGTSERWASASSPALMAACACILCLDEACKCDVAWASKFCAPPKHGLPRKLLSIGSKPARRGPLLLSISRWQRGRHPCSTICGPDMLERVCNGQLSAAAWQAGSASAAAVTGMHDLVRPGAHLQQPSNHSGHRSSLVHTKATDDAVQALAIHFWPCVPERPPNGATTT